MIKRPGQGTEPSGARRSGIPMTSSRVRLFAGFAFFAFFAFLAAAAPWFTSVAQAQPTLPAMCDAKVVISKEPLTPGGRGNCQQGGMASAKGSWQGRPIVIDDGQHDGAVFCRYTWVSRAPRPRLPEESDQARPIFLGGGATGITGSIAPVPIQGPRLYVSQEQLVFGKVMPNGSSQPRPLIIRNVGNAPSGPVQARITGAHTSDFGLSGVCTQLAAGASCRLEPRFLPKSPGLKEAALEIVTNLGIARVRLHGEGWGLLDQPDTGLLAGKDWTPDCPVVRTMALPDPLDSLPEQLASAFDRRTGRPIVATPVSPPVSPGTIVNRPVVNVRAAAPLATNAPPVRVAVVDSSARRPGANGDDNNPHGRVVGQTISRLSNLPASRIFNYLGLPIIDPITMTEDLVKGGDFGTVGHVAAALERALRDWTPTMHKERLVINLSIGWRREHSDRLSNEAMLTLLQRASCAGAIVVVAAGNGSGDGPLLPAAWETEVNALSSEQCLRRGYPVAAVPALAPVRPLLYSVGALDLADQALATTRPGSMPARVAHGLGFVTSDGGTQAILSGTSLAAAVVSGAAAAVWTHASSWGSHAIMARIDATGEPTSIPVERCFGGSGCGEARRVLVCKALEGVSHLRCPDTKAVELVTPATGDTEGGLDNSQLDCNSSDGCQDRNATDQELVEPQPGSAGCSECVYDRGNDWMSVRMRPEMNWLGVTVMRMRGGGFTIDVRYDQTVTNPSHPIPLPSQFGTLMGIWNASSRPSSATVQFGVYAGDVFVPASNEEPLIITNAWSSFVSQ